MKGTILYRTIKDFLPFKTSESKPIIAKDVTSRCAMFIQGEPFFQIHGIIWYELDFTKKEEFITTLQSIISTNCPCNDLDNFKERFNKDSDAIIYVIDQMTRDNRYESLKIATLRRIYIRDSRGKAVMFTNSIKSEDCTLVFDTGTVLRIAANPN